MIQLPTPEHFMKLALEQATLAYAAGEVPVGAVVVASGKVIAAAHNEIETQQDATAHAEILALKRASNELKRWRLNDAELYVTLEPCPMCIGAILLSRIKRLYFGAYDKRQGAVGSCFDLSHNVGLLHEVEVVPEVCATESQQLLQDFFQKRRGVRVVEGA